MALATDDRPGDAAHAAGVGRSLLTGRALDQLANGVTLSRLIAVGPIVWLMLEGRVDLAFWLFLLAGATDAVDGFIAKSLGTRSSFGAYFDPIADKALLTGVYGVLAYDGLIPVWFAVIVLGRDIGLVLGTSWMALRSPGGEVRPSLLGKTNTLLQIVLAALFLAEAGGFVGVTRMTPWLMYATAATTLTSGTLYVLTAARRGWALETTA